MTFGLIHLTLNPNYFYTRLFLPYKNAIFLATFDPASMRTIVQIQSVT